MIAYLRGEPVHFGEDSVILRVGDVGYTVLMPRRDLGALQVEGGSLSPRVEVWVESIVRENQQTLFGFLDLEDQEWFRLLLGVPGVGGRMALSLVSAFPSVELQALIVQKQASQLCRAEGIGPKLANRVVQELQKKAQTWQSTKQAHSFEERMVSSYSATGMHQEEVLQALCALGYKRLEAEHGLALAWKHAPSSEGTSADWVRLSLQHLSGALAKSHDALKQ